ncbi:MAG: hypothetical protein ABIJ09_23430 [Pseudomonadota bacterium]
MAQVFDTLLLLALPASGKSEIRRYLENVSPQKCERDFHIGGAVQLDDFPYVHVMRRVDDELVAMGQPRVFFRAPDCSFANPFDWGTLVHLVNEDYDELVIGKVAEPRSPGQHLLQRLDRAAQAAGIEPRLSALGQDARYRLADVLEREATAHLEERRRGLPGSLKGKTVVIEFARGGADGSAMPLKAPMGYQYTLSQLSDLILARAAILYVWVTPEESRRKNAARTDPDDPGSILHHGVPLEVMMRDYGCDDIDHLLSVSSTPGALEVQVGQRTYTLPLVRFDNRVDKTSFLRDDPSNWAAGDVRALHDGLQGACQSAYAIYLSRRI